VLLVDLDTQGNASTGLGLTPKERLGASSYNLFFNQKPIENLVKETRVPRLSLIGASADLAGADIELVNVNHRERVLRDYFLRYETFVESCFDYVIFDCPPSLNLTTLNALISCDEVLVPLQCEFYALEGLAHLTKTIKRVQKSYNPSLRLNGIVLTMYDKRNRLTKQVESDVRGFFPDLVYKTVIPRNVRVSEAPSHGLPAIVYDMHCPGSRAYIMLAKELLKRQRDNVSRETNKRDVAA
jgi:chromosome partitioning protein